jgi:hypothetical protein
MNGTHFIQQSFFLAHILSSSGIIDFKKETNALSNAPYNTKTNYLHRS